LIKAYIVCTGILYGHGERILYDHFRKAWIGGKLPLLGEGHNIPPTIHVVDVARLIKKVIFEIPKQQYILAVDHGMTTQSELVEALVNNNHD
jgi:adenylate kinase